MITDLPAGGRMYRGGPDMDARSRDLGSDVIDLSACPLDDIRDMEIETIFPCMERFLAQISRSRGNFSGGGPPGRAD